MDNHGIFFFEGCGLITVEGCSLMLQHDVAPPGSAWPSLEQFLDKSLKQNLEKQLKEVARDQAAYGNSMPSIAKFDKNFTEVEQKEILKSGLYGHLWSAEIHVTERTPRRSLADMCLTVDYIGGALPRYETGKDEQGRGRSYVMVGEGGFGGSWEGKVELQHIVEADEFLVPCYELCGRKPEDIIRKEDKLLADMLETCCPYHQKVVFSGRQSLMIGMNQAFAIVEAHDVGVSRILMHPRMLSELHMWELEYCSGGKQTGSEYKPSASTSSDTFSVPWTTTGRSSFRTHRLKKPSFGRCRPWPRPSKRRGNLPVRFAFKTRLGTRYVRTTTPQRTSDT